jgi:predicted AAA+ superfamily ATPase
VDGTVQAHSRDVRPSLDELAAAIAAVEGLLLYQGVLQDEPGCAYVDLLRALGAAENGQIRRAASALFRALAADEQGAGAGDAWQRHLIARLLLDDNPFSRSAQRSGAEILPGVQRAARHDLRALSKLHALNGVRLAALVAATVGDPDWRDLVDLHPPTSVDPLAVRLSRAAPDEWPELWPELARRYRERGTGSFARYPAFRWERRLGGGQLRPIERPDPITLDDLIGYADQRRVVRRNTEHFLAGLPANNLLLYGERGTGKSSTVKALLNAYGERGLRLVEVAKSALGDFPTIVDRLAERPQRFVVFVDDLSFDENEVGYTELKAILEGGIEVRPDNVIIYATSNRRHLVLERFGDRAAPGDEVHSQDTLQEKLSLADRFGVTVIFPSPDQEEYLQIVRGLARRRGLEIEPARLDRLALQWAAWNNGRSGRTARQFVDDLCAEVRWATVTSEG